MVTSRGDRNAEERSERVTWVKGKSWLLQTAQVLRAWPFTSGLGPHCR